MGRRKTVGPARRVDQIRTLETGAFGAGVSVPLLTEVSAFTARAHDDRVWKQFSKLGGSVSVVDGEAILSSGATQNAYSVLRTVQQCAYEPGKGLRIKWTTRFPDGNVTGAFQAAGPFHGEAGAAVGYPSDGSGFGFMFRRGRRFEIQALTITVAATGAETVTLTLNGVAQTGVAVTNSSAENNAKEIAEGAAYSDSGGLVDYDAYAVGAVVYLIRQTHGVVAGAFTVSSTGALDGTWAQTQAGAAGSQTWTAQADWSIDPCDGGGPSGASIDPTLGQVWAITYGWLGYLGWLLWVADPNEQRMIPVHFEPWAGTASATSPSVADPRFPIIYSVASLGSTEDVRVSGASCYIALEGGSQTGGPSVAVSARKTGVSSTEAPIVAAMTAPVDLRANAINRRRGVLRQLRVANVGAKDAIVNVYIGEQANLTGSVFESSDDDSILWLDTSANAITGTLDLVGTLDVPSGDAANVYLPDTGLTIYRGQVLIITGETSASTTELVVSINGTEDL